MPRKTTTISIDNSPCGYEKMISLLKGNEDWDFETFIQKLNRYRKVFDLDLDIEMLANLCNLYCSDIFVINYKNRKVVVVSNTIIGIVYYCETNKVVKSLDYDEYDEDEIMELINELDDSDCDEKQVTDIDTLTPNLIIDFSEIVDNEENDSDEEDDYVVRSVICNINSAGRWEGYEEVNGVNSWKTIEEARVIFHLAIESRENISVQLVNNKTEEIIDEWEKTETEEKDSDEEDSDEEEIVLYKCCICNKCKIIDDIVCIVIQPNKIWKCCDCIAVEVQNEKKNDDEYCGEPGSLNWLLGLPINKYNVTE
jgi:hypothetical protein